MIKHPSYGYCTYVIQLIWTISLMCTIASCCLLLISAKQIHNIEIKEINILKIGNSSYGFMLNCDECTYYGPPTWSNYNNLTNYLNNTYKIGNRINAQFVEFNNNNYCNIEYNTDILSYTLKITIAVFEIIFIFYVLIKILITNEQNRIQNLYKENTLLS